MAMLLHQQDLQVHTFPHPMFKVLNFTGHGYSCMPDKVCPCHAQRHVLLGMVSAKPSHEDCMHEGNAV